MSGSISKEPRPAASLHILVVEDHAPLREALCRYLTRLGHHARPATTLAEAGRALRESPAETPFQLLLVDMELPDGIGTQLLPALPPQCGFVTCSGFPQQLPEQRSAPWLMHLEKPFRIDELHAALRKAAAFAQGEPFPPSAARHGIRDAL